MKMNAPKEPTIVTVNPKDEEYVIQFAPELTDFIRKDGKVKTYRYGDKYEYLLEGDSVTLSEYGTGTVISKAVIKSKEHVHLKDIPIKLNGHEQYDSREHMRKVFSSYYAYIGREIQNNDSFLVFTFDLID